MTIRSRLIQLEKRKGSGDGRLFVAIDDQEDQNYLTFDSKRMTQAEYKARVEQLDREEPETVIFHVVYNEV